MASGEFQRQDITLLCLWVYGCVHTCVVVAGESGDDDKNSKPNFCFTSVIENGFHRATLLTGTFMYIPTSQLIEPSLPWPVNSQPSPEDTIATIFLLAIHLAL